LSDFETQGVAHCRLGGLDAFEDLAIHAERIELDGEEAETGIERNQDALRLAIDVDGYGLGAMWLFERGMLHGMTSIGTSLGTAGVLPEL
jgi:hypothetical protein